MGNANLNPWTEAKVDTKNPDRGPLPRHLEGSSLGEAGPAAGLDLLLGDLQESLLDELGEPGHGVGVDRNPGD
jgi:hypothetical protein